AALVMVVLLWGRLGGPESEGQPNSNGPTAPDPAPRRWPVGELLHVKGDLFDITPDGKRCLIRDGAGMHLWDLDKLEKLRSFESTWGFLAPSGRRAVLSRPRGWPIYLVDLDTGKELFDFE